MTNHFAQLNSQAILISGIVLPLILVVLIRGGRRCESIMAALTKR